MPEVSNTVKSVANIGVVGLAVMGSNLARNLAKQIREAVGENPELEQVLQRMER